MDVELEIVLVGIGGQGIQLAAKVLATSAAAEGRETMVFGRYGGSMRGGDTRATVVISDRPITSPPTVPAVWFALALHDRYWADTGGRVRSGGVVVIDADVFTREVEPAGWSLTGVPATKMATQLGNPRSSSMVALGALVAITGIVSVGSLEHAALNVLPPYRSQHAEAIQVALRAGYDSYLAHQRVAPQWFSAQATA
ncbi:2-oxoacid:acceptor oxidoreductase family protein [Mycolicibacterium sp. XJ1819]